MNRRRYLTAIEVEQEMQEKREMMDFIGKTETMLVTQMVKHAKANTRIGDKIIMVINPLFVHMPPWQRETDLKSALTIGNEYNSKKWELPKILHRKGKLICIDGKHRIYGAFKAGMEEVTVEIMEMTEKEAIELFLSQTVDRRKMTPSDIYIAAVAAGKEEYVQLREIGKRNGVRIKGDDTNIINPVGTLTSISDGIRMTRENPELLDNILQLIGKLQWNGKNENGKAYGSKILRVMSRLYAYYSGKERELERALLVNCKGAKFFDQNIVERSQSMTFDFLSHIISSCIMAKGIKVS